MPRTLLRRHCAARRRGGFVLALAVILLAFLSAAALGFAHAVRGELRTGEHHGFGAQAFHVADAGLRRGWYRLFRESPAEHSFSESRSWSAASGSFSGGLYSFTLAAIEELTTGSAAYGDLILASRAEVAGYGEVASQHALEATLPNLSNDADDDPATHPLAEAPDYDPANPASWAHDGDLSTGWATGEEVEVEVGSGMDKKKVKVKKLKKMKKKKDGGDDGELSYPLWWSVAFASPTTLRKVQVVFAEESLQLYEIQVLQGGAWTGVSNPSAVSASDSGRHVLTVVFDPVATTAVRIYILAASTPPTILEFKAYPRALGAKLKAVES